MRHVYGLWCTLQDGSWWWRTPFKSVLLGATVFLVCFPYPRLFVRNIRHWQDPNALIEPDAPGLQPWLAELKPELAGLDAGREALNVVQRFVYDKVPYAWDWDTWGVADYLPTVPETLRAGAEDCDGRAVVSASLLRNLGYKADLVTDSVHVWVKTNHGETMSPGRLPKLLEAQDGKVRIRWASLWNLPKTAAFGIAVFPLLRELIVVAVFWLLALRPGMAPHRSAICLALLLAGLLLLRKSGGEAWHPTNLHFAGQWAALVTILTGGVSLHVLQYRARHRTRSTYRDQAADGHERRPVRQGA